MSRLIDADEFKKQIAGMAIINNFPAGKANALCELIDVQPTAYDVDKVVEQLEGFREEMEQFGCSGTLTDIIETVKGGRVNE